LSGGCHLNRAIEEAIKRGGFSIEQLDKGYLRGPKFMTFMYEGRARMMSWLPQRYREQTFCVDVTKAQAVLGKSRLVFLV